MIAGLLFILYFAHLFVPLTFVEGTFVDYVFLCHDSAKHASMMALAAPSVRKYKKNKIFFWYFAHLFVPLTFVEVTFVDYVFLCHDSAKHASMMAFAAPSVRK